MAALSQQAVESAVDAYLQRDKGLCKYVKQMREPLTPRKRDLTRWPIELLAKEQPWHRSAFHSRCHQDQRRPGAIGDQSMGIARTKEMLKHEEIEMPVDLRPWANLPAA